LPDHALRFDLAHAETVEKAHGRIEIRKIASSWEVAVHLNRPGVTPVARIERRRRAPGRDGVEVASLVASLSAKEADLQRLLSLNRALKCAHWAIKNRLHNVCDVSIGEHRRHVRAGTRPLSIPRNLTLALLKKTGPIPKARETSAKTAPKPLKPLPEGSLE
jgi:hypothetical protein